jgi:hypothetical protein
MSAHRRPEDETLPMYVVYFNTRDYPGLYVVRRWTIRPGHTAADAKPLALVPSLEAARAAFPPGLYRIDRSQQDDPVIVESWI